MSLSQKIAAAVDDLVQNQAPPSAIQVEDGPYRLEIPVGQASPVGIDCRGFRFAASDRAERSLDDLKAWGNRLAKRVTYLMEPLAVQEADPVGGEVLLRSQNPTTRNGRRTFYEVRLRGGSLNFQRIAFDEATRKSQEIACQFTRETLERLVDDLVATA